MKINIEKTIDAALKAYGRSYEKHKWFSDLVGAKGNYEYVDYILYDSNKVPVAALYYNPPSNTAALWCVSRNLKLIVFYDKEYEMMKDPAYIEGKILHEMGISEGSAATDWLEEEENFEVEI